MSVVDYLVVLVPLLVSADIYNICVPSQWEGTEYLNTGTQIGDTPTFIHQTVRFSFDANNSRIAAYTSGFENERAFQRNYIFLYQKGAVYITEGDGCKAERISGVPKTCLPERFSWDMDVTWMGGPSSQRMFLYGFKGLVEELLYTVQVTMEPRLPLFQQIHGRVDDVLFLHTSQFVNVTFGIKDPDVFTLPASCQHVNPTVNTTIIAHCNLWNTEY